mmetsp:Transcript_7666/g.12903  ORF Transcript_7666/g.12903 Transcript_7666/m.12903 type:complete len:160 (-) Transcript_7666:46-525(-)
MRAIALDNPGAPCAGQERNNLISACIHTPSCELVGLHRNPKVRLGHPKLRLGRPDVQHALNCKIARLGPSTKKPHCREQAAQSTTSHNLVLFRLPRFQPQCDRTGRCAKNRADGRHHPRLGLHCEDGNTGVRGEGCAGWGVGTKEDCEPEKQDEQDDAE